MGEYMPIESQIHVVSAVSVESGPTESLLEEDEQAKADQLQKEVVELRKKETTCTNRLNEAKSFWENKVRILSQEVDDIRNAAQAREVELNELQHPSPEVPKRLPGPKCLSWVLEPGFTCLTILVILANIVMMFIKHFYPHETAPYHKDMDWANQFFLGFYVLELTLKIAVLHCKFFCGPPCIVWWNWLDVIIVLVGIADQWVMPLAVAYGYIDSEDPQALLIMRSVRIFRIMRVLKAFHGCLNSDLSWTEGHRFQLFMIAVIAFNSLTIAMQEDHRGLRIWSYIDGVLLVIYFFELSLRLAHWGCKFFYHKRDWMWNWLDFVIVIAGMLSRWLVPAIMVYRHCMGWPRIDKSDMQTLGQKGRQNVAQIMMIVRLARILRILRLVRLIRSVQPLYTLVLGILQAMQGMVWVMLLTALFLYVWAILGVFLVGHGLVFGGEAPVEVAKIFPNVPESMYVLFKVMNGDMDDLEPLFEVMPISKIVVVAFMVISSWAILSILTAVVSENMINATETHRAELEKDTLEDKQRRSSQKLQEIFIGVDADHSGSLSREEFESILEDPNRVDELSEACGLEKADFVHVFDLLSTNEVQPNGEIVVAIKRGDFIEGLQKESCSVTERAVMRLEKRLTMIEKGLLTIEHKAAKESDKIISFMGTVEQRLVSIKDASDPAPALAQLERRLEAQRAEAAAAAAASAEQAAEMQRMLARLEDRLVESNASTQQAQASAQAAAEAAAEAAKQSAAVSDSWRQAAAEAMMKATSMDKSFEAEPLQAATDSLDFECMREASASEGALKALLGEGEEEDPPLPVPRPRFASAPDNRGTARPAGTGEEPIGALRGGLDRTDGLVDPMDHLLN